MFIILFLVGIFNHLQCSQSVSKYWYTEAVWVFEINEFFVF